MDGKWSTAAIRIYSKELDIQQISDILNINPNSYKEKGAYVNDKLKIGAIREEYLWVLESGLETTESLETHIVKLLEIIETNVNQFKLLSKNCFIELFCGFGSENGQGSLVLDSSILKRLTAIPIDIILDLYPPDKLC